MGVLRARRRKWLCVCSSACSRQGRALVKMPAFTGRKCLGYSSTDRYAHANTCSDTNGPGHHAASGLAALPDLMPRPPSAVADSAELLLDGGN